MIIPTLGLQEKGVHSSTWGSVNFYTVFGKKSLCVWYLSVSNYILEVEAVVQGCLLQHWGGKKSRNNVNIHKKIGFKYLTCTFIWWNIMPQEKSILLGEISMVH